MAEETEKSDTLLRTSSSFSVLRILKADYPEYIISVIMKKVTLIVVYPGFFRVFVSIGDKDEYQTFKRKSFV